MNTLTKFMEEKLSPTFAKLDKNPYLRAVKNGMVAISPFTIIGSIFIIIQQFPVQGWLDIVAPYSAMLSVPNIMTIGIIALYIVFSIGYNLGKELDVDPLISGLTSFMAFMIMQVDKNEFTLSTAYFGSKGIFPAILVSIFAVKSLQYFERKGFTIKFPDSVPPSISRAFAALYPSIFISFVVFIVTIVFKVDIQEIIIMLFSPLVFALNTLPGILIYQLVLTLLWSSGIHGNSVLSAVARPIFFSYFTANAEAALAGAPIPYITAAGFTQNFVSIGGAGATLGLIVCLLFSKEKGYKQLGRMALPAGIFNINEPVIFGFPIVMNPVMMMPFVLVALVNTTLSYTLAHFNIIGRVIIDVPWVMPAPIGAYLATGGHIPSAIWSTMLIFISAAIYYPFFKVAEKQRINEESGNLS